MVTTENFKTMKETLRRRITVTSSLTKYLYIDQLRNRSMGRCYPPASTDLTRRCERFSRHLGYLLMYIILRSPARKLLSDFNKFSQYFSLQTTVRQMFVVPLCRLCIILNTRMNKKGKEEEV